MSIIQAVLIGLVYYCGSSFWVNGYLTVNRPFIAATLAGAVMGDASTGAMIGAGIQIFYMGWMSVGGSQPGDACLAAILSSVIAISFGFDAGVAVAIAVPLGLIGGKVWIGRNTMNVPILHKADKIAAEGKWKHLFVLNTLFPQMALLLITFLPITFITYFGVHALKLVLDFIPEQIFGILSTIGGVLPVVGIALNMQVIMKNVLIPYLLFGFFLKAYFDLPLFGIAVIFACVAMLHLFKELKEEM